MNNCLQKKIEINALDNGELSQTKSRKNVC